MVAIDFNKLRASVVAKRDLAIAKANEVYQDEIAALDQVEKMAVPPTAPVSPPPAMAGRLESSTFFGLPEWPGMRSAIRVAIGSFSGEFTADDIDGFLKTHYPNRDYSRQHLSVELWRLHSKDKAIEVIKKGGGQKASTYKRKEV